MTILYLLEEGLLNTETVSLAASPALYFTHHHHHTVVIMLSSKHMSLQFTYYLILRTTLQAMPIKYSDYSQFATI